MYKSVYFNLGVAVVLSVLVLGACFGLRENGIMAGSTSEIETVVIDAGHGGDDGGAVGKNGIIEKEINLAVSKKLEFVLNFFGVNTEMIRREDAWVSHDGESIKQRKVADIKKRVDKIRNIPNAVLISVHQNSFPQDAACFGSQVFYSRNNIESKVFAEYVRDIFQKGISDGNKREVKESRKEIYILNNVMCPAILVECGFLSNNKEAEMLVKDTYQTKVASCIAVGFIKYKCEKSGVI